MRVNGIRFVSPAATPHPRFARIASPVGELLAISDGESLSGLYLPVLPYTPVIPRGAALDELAFAALTEQLAAYFAGERRAFDIAVAPVGTAFQRTVWRALAEIPYGETRSYGEIAARIGRPSAARAVGAANGRNPISILVPCHRVIGASGALTGYAGGLDRKRALLDLERRTASSS